MQLKTKGLEVTKYTFFKFEEVAADSGTQRDAILKIKLPEDRSRFQIALDPESGEVRIIRMFM